METFRTRVLLDLPYIQGNALIYDLNIMHLHTEKEKRKEKKLYLTKHYIIKGISLVGTYFFFS